jgi:Asp/Glu/hydantoin racemase
MRIAWHVGLTEGGSERLKNAAQLWTILREHAAHVANPGTRVELAFSPKPPLSYTHPFLVGITGSVVAHEVMQLEKDGFDGVMVGTSADPGIYEARSAVHIPVVGSAESALAFSGFIGRRAGVICITVHGDKTGLAYVRRIENLAKQYGTRGHLLDHRPVRPIAQTAEQFFASFDRAIEGDCDELMSQLHAVMRDFAKDGADVLIAGNQFTGAVMRKWGQSFMSPDGIPFIDNVVVGIKMAEALVSLRQSMGWQKSEAGDFGSIPADKLAAAAGWFGQ